MMGTIGAGLASRAEIVAGAEAGTPNNMGMGIAIGTLLIRVRPERARRNEMEKRKAIELRRGLFYRMRM